MRDQRVSAGERTEVLALLNRAVDEGHLAPEHYHGRVAAVGTATYASQLIAPLGDLPPEYAWVPPAAPARPKAGRAALVLGVLSVPTAFCVFGGVLGVIAIVLSLRGERQVGMSAALFGRVFGIVGVILAIGALIALLYALNNPLNP
jgi:hypothetical protein